MQKKITHILQGKQEQITKEQSVIQLLPHKDFPFANTIISLHHLFIQDTQSGNKHWVGTNPFNSYAPVTFQVKEQRFHKDIIGNGISNKEDPTKDPSKNGDPNDLIQLWVNVPVKDLVDEPSCHRVVIQDLPNVLNQSGVQLRLAIGEYDGQTGPVKTLTTMVAILGKIKRRRRIQLMAQPGYWTFLYIAKGSIHLNCESIEASNLIIFERDNEEILISAIKNSEILFISVQPV